MKNPNYGMAGKPSLLKAISHAMSYACIAVSLTSCLPSELTITPQPSHTPPPMDAGSFTGITKAQTIGATKVQLSWNASDSSDITFYSVYDVTLANAPKLIKTVKTPMTSVTITGLTPSALYTFRVRASTDAGKEDSNKNDVAAIPYGGLTSAEVQSSTSALLTFEDGSDADQINIYCKTSSNGSYSLMKSLTNVSLKSTTLNNLVAGTEYTCRTALLVSSVEDNNAQTVTFTPMGSASNLVFSVQPSSGTAGLTLGAQPVITITDSNGNIVSTGPDSTPIVTLTLANSSPTIGTVRGTASVAAVKGVATFTGINFQETGIKVLTATKADTSSTTYGTPELTTDSAQFTILPGTVSKDRSTISISPTDSSLVANGSSAYTVTIVLADQFGNLISGVKPKFASSNSMDSLTQPTKNTDATGTVTGAIAATVAGNRTISISSPSGLSTVNAPVTFLAGSATKVAFVQQPSNSPAGPAAINNVTVAIQDAQGNTVTTGTYATADVTLSIFVNPTSGTLLGTATATAVNGVATFTGLGIDKTGTGFKFVANSPPLAVSYSNAFNITSGVPSKIAITGASTVLSGLCSSAYTIQLQDWAGNPANATANTPVVMSGLGSASMYTSSACAGAPISATLNYASGSNTKTIYFKDNKGEAITVTATDPSSVMSVGTKLVQVLPSQISLVAPTTAIAGQCSQAIMITTQGADNTAGNVYTNTSVQVTGLLGTTASLYSSPACTGSALDPSNITLAANTNLTNIYLKDNKSETITLSVVDPSGTMTTSSGGATLAVGPSNIIFTGPTTVVSGQCSTVFTVKIRDAAGNDVPVAADTTLTINGVGGTQGAFYSNSSCTGGTLGTSVTVPQNNSYTTIYFKDNSAETLALSISDPASNLAISSTINLAVSPSALALTAPSPASVATSVCSSAFTITTKDGAGSTTAAISPITVNLSGVGSGGTFYSDSSCTTAVTQFTFATGESTKQFYLMSFSPATSPTLTISVADAASVLTPESTAFTVTAAPAWIGTSGTPSWFETGKTPVGARLDGASSIYSMAFNSTKQYLYLADWQVHRVLKYDYTNQQYIGWIGAYNDAGLIGSTGSVVNGTLNSQCITMSTYQVQTPGWCQGGQSINSGTQTRGNLWNPAGVTTDGDSVYVTSYNGFTVNKYDAATGAFMGWIGRVNSNPTAAGTGLSNSCTSTGAGVATPGWCYGGQNSSYNGGSSAWDRDGGLHYPRAISYSDPYIYVSTYGAIQRYNASTGAFMGWIGVVGATSPTGPAPITPTADVPSPDTNANASCGSKTNGQMTPGWCMGGVNVQVNPNTTGFNNPTGIYTDSVNDYLYVSDQYGSTYYINKYQLSTGTFISTLIGSNLAGPYQMTSDGTNFYVADWTRILKLDSAGVIAGWIGKVSLPPVAGNPGCNTLVTNANTPGWCLGGSAKHGMDETAVHQLSAIAIDADGNLLTGQYANFPVLKKWDASTGNHLGSTSLVTTSPSRWSVANDFAGYYGFDDNSFATPTGMFHDGTYLYVSDFNGRIKKINKATGQTMGWIGGITTSPTGGDSGCAGGAPMSLSPGWCLGALPNPWYIWNYIIPQASDGLMYQPTGMTSDGTYLYTIDYGWHRIQKFQISNGAYIGWIGGLGSNPFPATCTGSSGQFSTSGWCRGGTPSSGSGDGYLSNPSGIYYNGGYLYALDRGNHRISKYNSNTGAFEGWIGRVNTTPTSGCTTAVRGGYTYSGTGWCKGGTATAAIQGSDPGGGFRFNSYDGIVGDGTYLYIANEYNSRIDRFNMTTGAYHSSVSSRWDQYVNTWTNNPTTITWVGYRPYQLWADTNYLYGIGEGYAVWKMNISTGSMVGWKGAITPATPPSGGEPGCVGATSVTPGWCTGGSVNEGYTLGKFTGGARYITGDSHYVYVSDQNSHRVTRLPK